MRPSRAGRALLSSLALLAVLIVPGSARADAVTDWNAIAAGALQDPAGVGGAGQGAPSTVHLAMVHGAVYDAVNAIDGAHEPYVYSPPAAPWYSQQAAVATAAYRMLTAAPAGVPPLGLTAARRPAVDAAYVSALAAIPDGPAKAGGVATGEAAAAAMFAARAVDGRFGAFRFTVGTLPGEWRPFPEGSTNDPGAWLKDVTPFVLRDRDRFRGRPPHGLTTRAYADELAEVQKVGSATATATERTLAQTAGGAVLGHHERHGDDGQRAALGRDDAGRRPGRERAPVREHLRERRGRADRHLAREGAVLVVAAASRDPPGRHGRQPQDTA